MKEIQNKLGIAVLTLIILGGVFYAGFSYGENQVPSQFLVEGLTGKTMGQPNDIDFSLFWDAWRVIEDRYVGRSDIDRQGLIFGAIEGMVKSLDDPYTVFFGPPEAKVFKEDVSGSFEGIGAEIGIRKDVLTIISPLEGSPAQAAGLRAEDKIIEIDGESTQDLTLFDAVQKIRGPKGTDVAFNILRNDDTQEITVTRNTIKIPVLKWELKEGGIAHIQLFSFSEEAPRAFRKAILEIINGPTNKFILDLRNNPGGFLEVAQELMGWFVSPGEIIAIEDFGDGRDDRNYLAIGNGALRNFDVVVLINGGSASASEIMAGALRDIRNTQLIGIKSFGKGSIQELETLKQKTSLKVTIARWLTPSGKSISQEGLEPDITVEHSEEDIEEGIDAQLDKAVEFLLAK